MTWDPWSDPDYIRDSLEADSWSEADEPVSPPRTPDDDILFVGTVGEFLDALEAEA